MEDLIREQAFPSTLSFPKHFLFGTAVSGFQVERTSGERSTDWDDFLKEHPRIVKTEEIGPDWWTHGIAEADVERLLKLGTRSIRISITWARIEPEEGKINKDAIRRYHEIIDFFTKHHMTVMVTLNHFTLPSWVAKRGGWQNDKIRSAFKNYVQLVVAEFPHIPYWITINEPSIVITLGYWTHFFPPGKNNFFSALIARNNMIRAHYEAYDTIKKVAPKSQVGMAYAIRWYRSKDPASLPKKWYTDVVNNIGSLNYIDATKDAIDFIGCNYYTGYYLDLDLKYTTRKWRKDAAGIPKTILFGETLRPGAYLSDMGWPVVPDFFLDLLRNLHHRYKKPIIITENGIADHHDKYRSFYILTHLITLWKALKECIDIRGYFHWSAVDNLEWVYGYRKEFGLIHVDHTTRERTLRESARLYSEIITSHHIDIDHLCKKYIAPDQQTNVYIIMKQLLSESETEPARCEYFEKVEKK